MTNGVTGCWCVLAASRELHQLQIPHSLCHRFREKCGLLMREQSRVSFTPAITLLFIHVTEMQETKRAENLICWRWEMGGRQQCHGKHICSLKANFISASKDCLWFAWFCPVVLSPKQSACIMLSCYKSGTDTLIFMQPVASVRRVYLKSPSGFLCSKNNDQI